MAKKINIVCTFEPCETSTSKITLVRTFSGPNLCDASVLATNFQSSHPELILSEMRKVVTDDADPWGDLKVAVEDFKQFKEVQL